MLKKMEGPGIEPPKKASAAPETKRENCYGDRQEVVPAASDPTRYEIEKTRRLKQRRNKIPYQGGSKYSPLFGPLVPA